MEIIGRKRGNSVVGKVKFVSEEMRSMIQDRICGRQGKDVGVWKFSIWFRAVVLKVTECV